MQTKFAKKLGIDFPIFAFTHCRDVVAAVTNAGGFGVLGAAGFSPEQLEVELSWIDEKVGDRPYGVDVIIPNKFEGRGEQDHDKLREIVQAAIPSGHREFARTLLDEHDVPPLHDGSNSPPDRLMMTDTSGRPLVEVALAHKNVKLIANALGTPPADIIKQVQDAGVLIGALCGSPKHAQHHVEAGMDFIIAQGYEGGGHTGAIGSMVLWPEVVEVAGDIPVLAAGGVGSGRQMAAALCLGAQGVWCGSIWLTTTDAETNPISKELLLNASSSDTVRSRSFTGKAARMLRNDWTNAWEAPGNPEPLGAPMQMMLASESLSRMNRHPEAAKDVALNPVGQIVGRMNQSISARDQVSEFVNEYLDTAEMLEGLMPSE
ncbi:MAG: nitronate monooxygenase family protein [Pseudomonadales bacterium]|nr:nitronate monooxygenase family protein [Pseudomonadales bacterium]